MSSTNNAASKNIFTANHESRGFLVQSQGQGLWMILGKNEDGCWKRVAQGFTGYLEACAVADKLV